MKKAASVEMPDSDHFLKSAMREYMMNKMMESPDGKQMMEKMKGMMDDAMRGMMGKMGKMK